MPEQPARRCRLYGRSRDPRRGHAPGTRPLLVITAAHPQGVVRMTLCGEMDIATQDDVGAAVTEVIESADVTAFHIDLNRVTFIDSAGLRSLLQARKQALDRQMPFTLQFNPAGEVARLIHISGLDDTLHSTAF